MSAVVLGSSTLAMAQPVTVAVTGSETVDAPREEGGSDIHPAADRNADDPDPRALAAAPAADQASGVAVAAPRNTHGFLNALLAVPRTVLVVALTGPRYAAGELDDYLESRSPNAFGRDVKPSPWRFGAVGDWETEVGPSVGLRLGYRFAAYTTADIYGGLFGARGQSGGLRLGLGRHTPARIEPVLTLDAGREMAGVFAGVGEASGADRDPYARGRHVGFDTRMVAGGAGLTAPIGPLAVTGRVVVDARSSGDDGDVAVSERYDAGMLAGFAEDQRATTGELAVVWDTRRTNQIWIPKAAPSTGLYVRGAVGYTRGDADRSGEFSTARATLEARRLFDLFWGDRVLAIGVRVEAISADRDAVPFDRLPSLGGRDWLRAFARDELRDRSAAVADVTYDWPVYEYGRGFVFVETGSVHDGLDDVAASRLHLGYGGGFKFLSGGATALRLQIAGSDDGDLGFLVALGAL